MVHLIDVNEENWFEIINLRVDEEQQKYLDRPVGIIARGYIYRHCNARVFGIADDSQIIGVALVRDLLRQILEFLKQEARFSGVEVCVNREDTMAIHVYEKAGFVDSGYIDEELPNCLNLIYHL